jgi:hypothetical protein
VTPGDERLGADTPRHRRVEPIGPHHQVRLDRVPLAARDGGDAAHSTVRAGDQAIHGHAVDHLGAAFDRHRREQAVEPRPPRRIQRLDAVLRLDRHGHVLVVVAERRGGDRRRAVIDDRLQHAAPVKLHDGAAPQGVRRERVGAVASAIDHHHAGPGPRQQQRRRGARAAGAHDDDIDLHDLRAPWVNASSGPKPRNRGTADCGRVVIG